MSEEVKRQLKKLADDYPVPSEHKKQQLIHMMKQELRPQPSISYLEFYKQQLRFIKPHTWLYQFILVFLVSTFVFQVPSIQQSIAIISAITPLLFLASFSELARSYFYETVEMELTTKFTIKDLLVVKMNIFGLLNIAGISVLTTITSVHTDVHPYNVFLYISIPFLVTTFICIWLLARYRTKDVMRLCYGAGFMVMIMVILTTTLVPTFLVNISIWIWQLVFFLCIIGLIYQTSMLLKQLESEQPFETIM